MRALPLFLSGLLTLTVACDDKATGDTGSTRNPPGEQDDDVDEDTDGDTGDPGSVGSETEDDDGDASVNPDATEICDDIDNNCDGSIDGEDAVGATVWFEDADGDGYGVQSSRVTQCDEPAGYSDVAGDCDDSDAAFHPGAEESCDTDIDYNCDGSTAYEDADGDGYPACEDCDDSNRQINDGGIEVCDGEDNDCDGLYDDDDPSITGQSTWYEDGDNDSYGDARSSTDACDQPSGWVGNDDDCDDADANSNPGEVEVCDDADNDCNGTVDDDATDASDWYRDSDGDGYGTGVATESCDAPSAAYTDLDGDCDDSDASVNPGESEVCDDADNDCDSTVDEDATDASYGYADDDGDGFGDAGSYDLHCDVVDNDWDCDDTDSSEPVYVDASASGSGTGTLARPYDSIQDGIDASRECVVVEGGTYTENLDFGGREVLVTGVDGAGETTIDGNGNGPVVTFADGEGAGAELRGFTLTGGSGYESTTSSSYSCGSGDTCTDYFTTFCGGGIYVDGATPTLGDLVIEDNDVVAPSDSTSGDDTYTYYSYGGGLCVLNSTLTIGDVDFWDNSAEEGGAIYVDATGSLAVERGWIASNTAENGAGVQVDGGTLDLTNVASTWNAATLTGGGVLAIDAQLTETNVTHGGDDAPTGGGIYLSGSSTGTVMNTIVYGADSGEGVLVDSGSFSGSYNNVYGNGGGDYSGTSDPTGSSGNLSSDPRFTDVTDDGRDDNDDWSLSNTSPSVDAGNSSAVYDDADGTDNDQGAWGGGDSDWD